MTSKIQYWLMKTEPDAYSIDRLEKEGKTQWEGVRNYQARNFMRDKMQVGDKVLFYHSNATPPGIVGLAEVSKLAYPDHFAWDPKSKYFDPKAGPENPIWQMVEVKFVEKFKKMISLDQLKSDPKLENLLVIRRGMRLSIQPVEKQHYEHIVNLAHQK